MNHYTQTPAEYGYTVIGLDGEWGSTQVRLSATPLTESHNQAIQKAFAIADGDSLKRYEIVYILSGDQKTIIDHVRWKRMTLQEILAWEIQQVLIPLV